jgi:hypothetical protein
MTVVFVELGILEIAIGFREQLLVVEEAMRNFAAAVRDDNHALEGRVLPKFFER